jgi:hypothetical protein
LVKKNAGLIICHKGNGLATLVGTRDHGLEFFDFSNPFPLENGGTSQPLLLLPRPLVSSAPFPRVSSAPSASQPPPRRVTS